MNLYVLDQSECRGYDTFDSVVVAAKSAWAARGIHPRGGKIGDDHGGSWPNERKHIKATMIGVARKGTVEGVILASFNAG